MRELQFINKAEPENTEWASHIKLLNEWTTPDRILREIVIYARSGPHHPAHMHVDLIEQYNEYCEKRAMLRQRAYDQLEIVNVARISALLDLEQWIKLHNLDTEQILDGIEHMAISIAQRPNQQFLEHPERLNEIKAKAEQNEAV